MLQLQITQHTHSTILFIDVRILILFFFFISKWNEKKGQRILAFVPLWRVHLGGGSERYFPVTWFSITSKRTKTQHFYLFNCATDQYVSFSLGWIEKKGMCFDISLSVSFLPIHYFFLSSFYVIYNGKIDCSEIDDNIKSAIGGSQPKLARRNATNGKNHNHNHSNKNPHRAKKAHTQNPESSSTMWNLYETKLY